MTKHHALPGLAIVLLLFGIFLISLVGCQKSSSQTETGKQYTCPMHPEIVQNAPGKCPKCGMELKPK